MKRFALMLAVMALFGALPLSGAHLPVGVAFAEDSPGIGPK